MVYSRVHIQVTYFVYIISTRLTNNKRDEVRGDSFSSSEPSPERDVGFHFVETKLNFVSLSYYDVKIDRYEGVYIQESRSHR